MKSFRYRRYLRYLLSLTLLSWQFSWYSTFARQCIRGIGAECVENWDTSPTTTTDTTATTTAAAGPASFLQWDVDVGFEERFLQKKNGSVSAAPHGFQVEFRKGVTECTTYTCKVYYPGLGQVRPSKKDKIIEILTNF